MYNYLIIGAGLYGAVFAQQAKAAGKSVLVIDKRDHIAGNVYTEKVEGIDVHKYGAHIFHTNTVRDTLSRDRHTFHQPQADKRETDYGCRAPSMRTTAAIRHYKKVHWRIPIDTCFADSVGRPNVPSCCAETDIHGNRKTVLRELEKYRAKHSDAFNRSMEGKPGISGITCSIST